MNPALRADLAYIVAGIAGLRIRTAVFDYSQSKYRSVSGDVSASKVHLYDYERANFVTGQATAGGQLLLFDFADGHYVNLNVRGKEFRGYDFGSSSSFQGHISGNVVYFYDMSDGKYYNYSV